MATTMDRTGVTLADDTGTPANPNNDGTLIDNTWVQNFMNRIDGLFTGATFVVAGRVQADGFGTHTYSAGGTGAQVIVCRNTTNGGGNYAELQTRADGSTTGALRHHATSFTTSGVSVADGTLLAGSGAGGLNLAATHGSGVVRLLAAGSTEVARATSVGLLVGRTTTLLSATSGLHVNGPITSYASTGAGIYLLFDQTGGSEDGFAVVGDNSDVLRFMDFTAGTGTTRAQMTGAGQWQLSDGSDSVPALSFMSDTDTGLTLNGVFGGSIVPNLSFVVAGTQAAYVYRSGTDIGLLVGGAALGTGAVAGGRVGVGRNSSGSGATGVYSIQKRNGDVEYLWADSSSSPGQLRIGTGRPTENNTTVSDTSGTVVGSQTSAASAKVILGSADPRWLLEQVLAVPLRRFRYRGQWSGEEFAGLVTDEAPYFGLDRDATHPAGRILNEVNAIGALMGAVQALTARLEALESAA